MLASDPASCPRCQHESDRRPSGQGSSSDSGQEGSGSGDAVGSEDEVGADVARTSEDGASLELGKEDEEGPADGAARLCEDVWRETRAKLRGIVDSKYFNRGIMVAILTNTLSMGVEYHEQVGAPHRQPSEWPWGTSRLPVPPAGFSLSWAPQRALSGWGIGVAVGLKVDCEGVFTVHSADAPAAHWWASAEWRQRDCGSIRRSSVWAGALRSQTQRQQGAEGTCQAIWCFSRWDSQSPAFMDGAPHMSWAFRLGFPGRPQRGMWQWHMVLARGPCPGLGLPQGAAAGLAGRGRLPWGPRPVHS